MTQGEPVYRLGLPAWAYPGWKDRYFPGHPSPLAHYAKVFNSVEGNTTFYRVPDKKTVEAWLTAVRDRDFRFCFKLPRTITHEREPSWADLRQFLEVTAPLRAYMGPLLIQFPARLGPDDLNTVQKLFGQLPKDLESVIEVRDPRFFSQPELLEPLLERHQCGRVIMDTRPIYLGDGQHPEVLAARHEKPDLPVLDLSYNDKVFLRLVLHPDPHCNRPYVEDWVERIAAHIQCGQQPWVMIHCPNNLRCPEFAKVFHQGLMAHPTIRRLEPLPGWSVPVQGELF